MIAIIKSTSKSNLVPAWRFNFLLYEITTFLSVGENRSLLSLTLRVAPVAEKFFKSLSLTLPSFSLRLHTPPPQGNSALSVALGVLVHKVF